jgi:peptide/nickel transport system ATP-binding protein
MLEVRNLSIEYRSREGRGTAVENVSFNMEKGQVIGLVGESGSGKSTLGWSIIRMLPRNARILEGSINFKQKNILSLTEKELNNQIRGSEISVIIQDFQNALNPVFSISTQLNDILSISKRKSSRDTESSRLDMFRETDTKLREKLVQLLYDVGIADAERRLDEYPHNFSGGMKQRIMMVMAFIVNPSLLIADEPTTALDVTVAAQIIEQLKHLIDRYHTSVLYITHDLGIVSELADRVMVMYAGNVVEVAETEEIFNNSFHPYTQALLRCLPSEENREEPLDTIPGTVPNIFSFPSGCRFHPRCRYAREVCTREKPILEKVSNATHQFACFFPQKTV